MNQIKLLLLTGALIGFGNLARVEPVHADEKLPHAVFLVSEDPHNYEAHKTIPEFARALERDGHFRTTVLEGQGEPNAFAFEGLDALETADLLVIFFRRRALPEEQLATIREYLAKGKPLVGIRTANHGFSIDPPVAAGHAAWWEFVPEVLGCENRGYGTLEAGTEVEVVKPDHAILAGISVSADEPWRSAGSLYLVAPLVDPQATVLLQGSASGKTEPVAWTRMHGKSRVFYTSLGYPSDFDSARFRRLLVGGMQWAIAKP